jgi:FtsZ-binding cell division protein ZapB
MNEGMSSADKLKQLLESFQAKQQSCAHYITSLEQIEIDIHKKCKEIEKSRMKVDHLKDEVHSLQQEQELLLETERVLLQELQDEQHRQQELQQHIVSADGKLDQIN